MKKEDLKVGMKYFFIHDHIEVKKLVSENLFTIKDIEFISDEEGLMSSVLYSNGGVLRREDWDNIWVCIDEENMILEKVV